VGKENQILSLFEKSTNEPGIHLLNHRPWKQVSLEKGKKPIPITIEIFDQLKTPF
jgi:hypothetical protein